MSDFSLVSSPARRLAFFRKLRNACAAQFTFVAAGGGVTEVAAGTVVTPTELKTTRKPRSLLRCDAEMKLRDEDRLRAGGCDQLPPRWTRFEASFGPRGSSDGVFLYQLPSYPS